MSSSGLCKRVEKGMTELLDEGRTVVKAGEIAERGDIEKRDGYSPGGRVGYSLAYGACGDFDDIGYEILSNDDDSNEYRLWKK